MNRQRIFKWLRIAWSVCFEILCVLLIALWVRSYRLRDEVSLSWKTFLGSNSGTVYFHQAGIPLLLGEPHGRWFHFKATEPRKTFKWQPTYGGLPGGSIYFPHWFLVVLILTIAALPWIPWSTRFSLRTLLIVTTLIVVTLGLGVYFARQWHDPT
jgi:hypothetical protein